MAAMPMDVEAAMEVEKDAPFPTAAGESYPTTQLLDHEKPFVVRDSAFLKRYMIKPPLGYALLLGSSQYDAAREPLLCVKTDLDSMQEVLSSKGWDVEVPYGSFTSREDYEAAVQKLRGKQDLGKYSCFMLYFSGHGMPEGLLLQENSLVPFKAVIDMVQDIQALRGKPKILIFDCCRGREGLGGGGGWQTSGNPNVRKLGENFTDTHHDMIVCFACSHNTESISAVTHGSLFTQHFVIAMRQFSQHISFVEVLDQAKGGTLHIAREVFKTNQQSVSYNGLNAQLLLKETKLGSCDRSKVKLVESPVILVPLQQCEHKGMLRDQGHPRPPVVSSSQQPLPYKPAPQMPPHIEPVMKDNVTTAQRFTTKQDIMANVTSLGRGHNVFLCYLPDPGSPYGAPDPARVEENTFLVSLLHYDLTSHCFSVTSDLNLGDQRPHSMLQWYISRIHSCHHVILVCSPAFCELFSTYRPQREVVDPRARRFLSYSAAIYAECESDMREGGGMSKFIPVILHHQWEDVEKSVPLLFRSSSIYKMFETERRRFDYDNNGRDFERLVCRMVGINRAQMNAPKPGAVFNMTKPSSLSGDVNRRRLLAQAAQPRKGYVTIPSSVGQPSSSRSAQQQAWAAVSSTPSQQPQTTSTAHPQPQTIEDLNRQRLLASVPRPGYHTVPSSVAPPHPNAAAGGPPVGTAHVPSLQRQPQASSQAPPPIHQLPPSSLPQDPTTLPPTPPSRAVLMWLSDHLVKWRFFARHLGLEEHTIERIAAENQNDIREQCYQMLVTFQQQEPQMCTYRRLGEVLLESEKNRRLFDEYCTKVSSQ